MHRLQLYPSLHVGNTLLNTTNKEWIQEQGFALLDVPNS